MSPLVWLAIPLVTTCVAAFAVPLLQRRGRRRLTAVQRAERMRSALQPGRNAR